MLAAVLAFAGVAAVINVTPGLDIMLVLRTSVFGSTLLLTLVDVAELSVLYGIVSGAAAALSRRLAKASFRRRMEQISGVVFLGFAASLVWDRA